MFEVALFAIFIALISFAAMKVLQTSQPIQVALPVLTGISIFLIRFFQLGLHKISEQSIATYLNTQYAELNASADLLLKARPDLSSLAKLQQVITYKNLDSLSARIHLVPV
jgi:hypothetical protein